MAALLKAITDYAAAQAEAGDWQAVADLLNESSQSVRVTDLRTTRWLMQQLTSVVDSETGATEADLVLGTLQASTSPRVRAAYESMNADGIDLSDPQVQGMIGLLGDAGGWPASLVSRIRDAGIEQKSLAAIAGCGIVSAEQVKECWLSSQAIAQGDVVYDQHSVLLSVNCSPGKTLMSMRITDHGTFNGALVSGPTRTVRGTDSAATGKEREFLLAVQKAISDYLSEV